MFTRHGNFLRSLPTVSILLVASIIPFFTPYPFLSLIPGIAIPAIIIIARRPEWGIYAIIFLIPFGNFRSISGPLENIKIHWIIALLLLVIVAGRLTTDRPYLKTFHSNLWPWLLGFLVASVLSAMLSGYKTTVANQVALTVIAILFVSLTMSLLTRESITKHVPAIIAVSISIGSLFAALSYFFHVSWFSKGDVFVRSTGGTGDPNILALQIIFGLPFIVFWLTHTRHKLLRILAMGMIGINMAALVGTYSRSGALVVFLSFIVLFFVNARGIKPKNLGLVVAGALVLGIISTSMLPQSFWERQASLFSSEKDKSLQRRGSYLIVARQAFLEKPILGHGPGTFPDYYGSTRWAEQFQRKGKSAKRYAHNTYLEVLVGTGLLGFFFYLCLLMVAIRNFIFARQRFIAIRDWYQADLVAHYLVAFIFLLLYMVMLSDVYQKFMLLCLGISVVWVRVANQSTTEKNES